MKTKQKLYTGQIVTLHRRFETFNETVLCHVCGETIGLRDGNLNGATGLAWIDPYVGKKGKYVHYDCLSKKRKKEIQKL